LIFFEIVRFYFSLFCWFSKSVQFPPLFHFLQEIEKSEVTVRIQFLLDPLAFSEIHDLWKLLGTDLINHVYYLIRTYAYYLNRRKQILTGNWLGGHLNYRRGHRKGHRNVKRITINDKITNAIMISGGNNLIKSTDVDATLPAQSTTATSSHMTMSTVHQATPPAHVIPSMLLPVPTAAARSDQLVRPDETETGGPHDGGVGVCTSEARRVTIDRTENSPINTSEMALPAGAEHECGGGYDGVRGTVDDSVAEIQPVMMCEGEGGDGVTDGVKGTTAVLPLQSEDRVSPTWEQGGPALSGYCFFSASKKF
jgi:hypothetical protein